MKKDKLSFWAFADLLWYATAKTIICWFSFKPVSGILFYDSVLMGSFMETTSLIMLEAPCTRLPFSCFINRSTHRQFVQLFISCHLSSFNCLL